MVRLKNRYSVISVVRSDSNRPAPIDSHGMMITVLEAVRRLHGAFGEAAVQDGLNVRYVNAETGIVVVRARRGPHRLVISALPLIRKPASPKLNFPIAVNTLYTGATVKQCLLFIQRYQIDKFNQEVAGLTDKDKEAARKNFMSINI